MSSLSVRAFLLLPWLLCSGCGGSSALEIESEDDMQQFGGIPPWHMWGNSLLVEVPFSVAILYVSTSQIVRLNYARPESFNFLFSAQLARIPEPVNPGQIRVSWDLTVGLGRSRVTLTEFEQYVFTWPGPTNPTGELKWSTQVVSPLRVDGTATSTGIVDHIVAEDIQLNARVDFGGIGPFTEPALVQLSAYFSPVSHIRPEWYEGRFPGGEDSGH